MGHNQFRLIVIPSQAAGAVEDPHPKPACSSRVHRRQGPFRPSDQCLNSGQRKELLCEFIPIEGEVNEVKMPAVDIPVRQKLSCSR